MYDDSFTRFWLALVKLSLAGACLWLEGKIFFWTGLWP